MGELVIGVPARNEGDNIGDLVDRLEYGAELLGLGERVTLVLAYQPGDDDTRERWDRRAFRVDQHVLEGKPGEIGKGRNVKALIAFARASHADRLLLIDADLRGYEPGNVVRIVEAARELDHSLVLPLWRRAPGQENTTKYLASPLLRAAFDACVRQPIAGQMLLDQQLLAALDLAGLPDDFGIDLAITIAALSLGHNVGQVVVASPAHASRGPDNSERVMLDVTRVALALLGTCGPVTRRDVRWPERYSELLSEPPAIPGSSADFLAVLARHARTEDELGGWLELLNAPDDVMRDLWCERLAEALRRSRRGEDPGQLADGLVAPFLLHAEHRRRHGPTNGAGDRRVRRATRRTRRCTRQNTMARWSRMTKRADET